MTEKYKNICYGQKSSKYVGDKKQHLVFYFSFYNYELLWYLFIRMNSFKLRMHSK